MLRGFFDKKVVKELKEHPVYVEQKGLLDEARRFLTEGALTGAFYSLATGDATKELFGSLLIMEGVSAGAEGIHSFARDNQGRLLNVATSLAAALGAAEVAGFLNEFVPPPYLFAFALVFQALKNAQTACHSEGDKRVFAVIASGLCGVQGWNVIQGLICESAKTPLMWTGVAAGLAKIVALGAQDVRACRGDAAGYSALALNPLEPSVQSPSTV